MKIKITITDDDGKIHEGELDLKKSSSNKPQKIKDISKQSTTWYRSGSITEKVIRLIDEGFFSQFRSISDIIVELKTKDYHLKPSDLTQAMRALVRKDLLKKTKELPGGTRSKNWMYIKK